MTKNWILAGTFLLLTLSGFSQSKKELIKSNEALKIKSDSLAAVVDSFNNIMAIDLNNENEKLSYAIGLNICDNLKQQGMLDSLDPQAFAKSISDAIAGTTEMTSQEAGMFLQSYFEKLQAAQEKENQSKFQANIEIGKKFLAENGKKPGVVTLPSGLQYEIMKAGTGAKPTAMSTVETHYHGTLIDGTVFDSSVDRGQPATFGVGQVISGWTEALQLMPVGSKWKLYLPYNLAYGDRGAGGAIQPYSTLIFEVELLAIK